MNDPIRQALSLDPACPPLENLAAAMSLDEHDEHHSEAAAHIAACGRCRAAYLLQLDFNRAVPTREEEAVIASISARMKNLVPASTENAPVPIRQPRRGLFWTPRFFTTIAAAAAISILAIGLRRHTFDHPVLLSENSPRYRAATLQVDSPVGDLTQIPPVFRWSAGEDAHHFVLTVTEVDGAVVYQAPVYGTSTVLPAEVRALLRPGRTLLWSVKAFDASGNLTQQSKVEPFRLIWTVPHTGDH